MKRTQVLFILIALLVGPSAGRPRASGSDQQPKRPFYSELSWSPDGSRILFSAYEGKNADIYIMKADGSEVRRLTDHPSQDMFGSFSPDGRRIVFQSKRDGSDEELYVMKSDGSGITRLTNQPGRDIAPSWSPDGTRIVFSSSREGGLQLFMMKANGDDQTQLIKNPVEGMKYYNAVWSPNGKQIVFYSVKGDNKDQIWLVNADGTGLTMLTGGVGHNVFPSWSTDGKEILFTGDRDDARDGIFTMNLKGSDLKRFGKGTGFFARWSPDGKKMAFLDGNYPVSDIYVINRDGSGLIKLNR